MLREKIQLWSHHTGSTCTHLASALSHSIKILCKNLTSSQGLFVQDYLFFFPPSLCLHLCSSTDRHHHRWCCYPPGPSSRNLSHLPLILFQPSAPLSPTVNTEALNAAQTVRERLQRAFHTLHSVCTACTSTKYPTPERTNVGKGGEAAVWTRPKLRRSWLYGFSRRDGKEKEDEGTKLWK